MRHVASLRGGVMYDGTLLFRPLLDKVNGIFQVRDLPDHLPKGPAVRLGKADGDPI
ncbi:hypothetical protein GHK39_17450 [Sinorhizobium medicae]|uniref:hypothetical protein n=1 Tax=Sinorhizobium medicae TaxID=110321 RepID=UPI0012957A99|nr:hypothetical protein [Sinorhizobium medicae]MDX0732425.1 hypothetical protein [Sinorhizobium medicae]MQV86362.1 hypothetical protein [Sinorhizobium medicae]UWU11776.1 hypothetical protein N2598_29905 [Sinorhizobium medicae]